jgi:hypothetical protein
MAVSGQICSIGGTCSHPSVMGMHEPTLLAGNGMVSSRSPRLWQERIARQQERDMLKRCPQIPEIQPKGSIQSRD